MRYAVVALLAGFAAGCSHPVVPADGGRAPQDPSVRRISVRMEDDSVRLGKAIFDETPKYAAGYVGNALSCNDCHIQSGTAAFAAPMIGLPGLFPMFNQRAGRVISLNDRIQECFVRSENGHPLAEDGREMRALVAYIEWISAGYGRGQKFSGRGFVKLPTSEASAARGEGVYREHCAPCHGADGAGAPPIIPALWGPLSYNDAAGMNTVPKMAAFVQHNMPQNHPGTLAPQDAFDVAAFVHTKPRPRFNSQYAKY